MPIVDGADRLGRRIWIDTDEGTISYTPPESDDNGPLADQRRGERKPAPCFADYSLVESYFLTYLKRRPDSYAEADGYGRFGLPCSVVEAEIASSPEAEAKRTGLGPGGLAGPSQIPGFVDPKKATAPEGLGIVVDALAERLLGPLGDALRLVRKIDESLSGQLSKTLEPLLKEAAAPGAVITQRLAESLANVTPLALSAISKTVSAGMEASRKIAENAATLDDIGGFLTDLLTGNREGIVRALWEAIEGGMGTGILSALHEMENENASEFQAMLARMADMDGIPNEVREVLRRASSKEAPAPFIVAIAGLAAALMMFQGVLLHSEVEKVRQQVAFHNPSYLMSPTEAAEAAVRDLRGYAEMAQIAQRHGLDEHQFRVMADLAFRYPPPEAIVAAELRGIISPELAEQWLNRQNYDVQARRAFRSLGQVLPGLQDLITMAVRGAFTPREIETFQLGEDLPEEFVKFAAQQGYSREWSQRSWYAHWTLPSTQQVFEMLHRGVIEPEVLDLYLKAADYSVFWRDALRQISYNVFTRVDVRRIHDLRNKDRAWLVEQHKRMGYSPEDAEELSDFVVMLNDDERKAAKRDLTFDLKGRVVSGIVSGMFTEEEAKPLLTEMGYSETQIADLVLSARVIRSQEHDERVIDLTRALYVKGRRTKAEANERLSLSGLNAEESDRLLREWDLERELRAPEADEERERDLTKGEILDAMEAGIFTEAEARTGITALRYDPSEVNALVSLRVAKMGTKQEKDDIEVVHRKFLRGVFDRASAAVELGAIVDRPKQIEALLLKWEAEKESKDFDLSVAQVGEAFQRGIMDEQETDTYLSHLGASEREREVLLLLWNAKGAEADVRRRKAEDAEEQRKIREAERVLVAARRADKAIAQRDLFRAYDQDVITLEVLRKELLAKGYSVIEVETLIITHQREREVRSARKQ